MRPEPSARPRRAAITDGALSVAVVALALMIGLVVRDAHLATVLTTGMLFALSAIGLNLLFGYAGDLSIGQAGFLAIGSYVTVVLGNRFGLPYALTALIGTIVATAVAALVATAVIRARGMYFAMITVAFGLIAHAAASQWLEMTGGPSGLFVDNPPVLGADELEPGGVLILVGLVLAVVYWLVSNLTRHHWGRSWKAIQASPAAAESVGLSTRRLRLVAFALSGCLAGLAGALVPIQTGYLTSDSYGLNYSVFVLLVVLVGGAGSRVGPLLGAAVLDRKSVV